MSKALILLAAIILSPILVQAAEPGTSENLYMGRHVELSGLVIQAGEQALVVRSSGGTVIENLTIKGRGNTSIVVDAGRNTTIRRLSCMPESSNQINLHIWIVTNGILNISDVRAAIGCNVTIVAAANTITAENLSLQDSTIILTASAIDAANLSAGHIAVLGARSGRLYESEARSLVLAGSGGRTPFAIEKVTIFEKLESHASYLQLQEAIIHRLLANSTSLIIRSSVVESLTTGKAPMLFVENSTIRTEYLGIDTRAAIFANVSVPSVREKLTTSYLWPDHKLVLCCQNISLAGNTNITIDISPWKTQQNGKIDIAVEGWNLSRVLLRLPNEKTITKYLPKTRLIVMHSYIESVLPPEEGIISVSGCPDPLWDFEVYLISNIIYLSANKPPYKVGLTTSVVSRASIIGNVIIYNGNDTHNSTLLIASHPGTCGSSEGWGLVRFFHNIVRGFYNVTNGFAYINYLSNFDYYYYNNITLVIFIEKIGNYYDSAQGEDINGDGVIDNPTGVPKGDTRPLAKPNLNLFRPSTPLLLVVSLSEELPLAFSMGAVYGGLVSVETYGNVRIVGTALAPPETAGSSGYLAVAIGQSGSIREIIRGLEYIIINIDIRSITQPPQLTWTSPPTLRTAPELSSASERLILGLATKDTCASQAIVALTYTGGQIELQSRDINLREPDKCAPTATLSTLGINLPLAGIIPVVIAAMGYNGLPVSATTVFIVDSWISPVNVTISRTETAPRGATTTPIIEPSTTTSPLSSTGSSQTSPQGVMHGKNRGTNRALVLLIAVAASIGPLAVWIYRRGKKR